MSATCLESHHISEIQRRYYQNSLLSAPRQEKKCLSTNSGAKLTGSQKRKLKRKKREEEATGKNGELTNDPNGVEREEFDGNQGEKDSREKKLSKRSAHWSVLGQVAPIRSGEGVSRETEAEGPTNQQQLRDGESVENHSFFGWLTSFFQSTS